jgi:hypothetical protein
LDIGFIDNLYIRLGTTSNYSATFNLHNSQMTTAHAKSFPACCVFTSRSLPTASNNGHSSASRSYVPSSQTSVHNWLGCPNHLLYNSFSRSSIKQYVSVARGMCLLSRCLKTVLVYLSSGRCIVTALHATIRS